MTCGPNPVALSPDLFAPSSAAAAGAGGAGGRSRTWALVAAVVLAVLGIGAGVTVWATGDRRADGQRVCRSRAGHRHRERPATRQRAGGHRRRDCARRGLPR